ncbi:MULTISPECIES: CotY/CotZ family spore coat protein [Bacillus]|uniref:CotY/CotZ family spore coat protein n=1 Tax=Bacillus TaxID=1386 RepID=UPI000BB87F10|nr:MULTISPECIES: CotY/CotZ family spore coat protein [Bacillus]
MKHGKESYFTSKLQQILFIQKNIQEPAWFSKLFLVKPVKDTIPLLLYLKTGQPFTVFGNISKGNEEFFTTSFFRVDHIQNDYVVLKLLKPEYSESYSSKEICEVASLRKTNQFIDVDITILGGIQTLNPDLVE